jgi:hypothetical protein
MPPGRPVRRWPVAGSPSQGQPGTERRCRCDWRHAARWSRPPPTLNGSCTRWCRRARGAPRPPARLDHPAADRHLWAAAPADRLGRRDHRDRGQPARLGPPCTAAGPRDRRAHWRHHHAGPGLAAGPAAPARRGPDRGRQRAVHLVARWPLPSDAAFAILGRPPPIPASSGQTVRVRLNRSGDRQLNQALHLIVLTRLRYDLRPGPMPNTGAPRARPTARSNAPWSATSPASSTDSSSTPRFDPTYERPCRPLSPARWAALGRADAWGRRPWAPPSRAPAASSAIQRGTEGADQGVERAGPRPPTPCHTGSPFSQSVARTTHAPRIQRWVISSMPHRWRAPSVKPTTIIRRQP